MKSSEIIASVREGVFTHSGPVPACLDRNKTAKKQMLDYEAVKSKIFTKRKCT
jgi:hypothetical protein